MQEILHQYLPSAEVWAYGSRGHGNHYEASDLDLVVRQPEETKRDTWWFLNDLGKNS